MSTIEIDLPSIVHKNGFRLTPQRQVIMNAVIETGRHADVDEIYKRVRRRSKAISLPTVYRTLDFLCDLRLVTAIQVGRKTLYEIAGDRPHHHIICRNCGKVEILEHKEVQSLFSKIELKHNFWVDMDHLGIFGLCAKCKQARIIS
jgi:Fur family transcriptional regulator, ferric uptake regulator